MNIHQSVVGIDVAKHHLDIFVSDGSAPSRIDNASDAIDAILACWQPNRVFVVFEATGRYDRPLTRALEARGIAFARVNPAQARDFARAIGKLAKTDSIDAAMLAEMGQRLSLEATGTVCPQRRKLADLITRRDQLVAMRAQERTRLADDLDDDTARDLEDHIDWLGARICTHERRIAMLIAETSELAEQATVMQSVPGVGPVTVAVLLALMPELGTRSRRAVAALAGVAPINADSGQHRGKRRIRGGRHRVRTALYMAAISAVRSQSRFKTSYQNLLSAGKPPKVALIAIARKILVTLNAVVRDRREFQLNSA